MLSVGDGLAVSMISGVSGVSRVDRLVCMGGLSIVRR